MSVLWDRFNLRLSEVRTRSFCISWIITPTAEIALMSHKTNQYFLVDPASGALITDSPAPTPDGKDGVRFE